MLQQHQRGKKKKKKKKRQFDFYLFCCCSFDVSAHLLIHHVCQCAYTVCVCQGQRKLKTHTHTHTHRAVDKAICCFKASCCWNVKQPDEMCLSVCVCVCVCVCQYPVALYPGGAINTTSDTSGKNEREKQEERGGEKRQGRKTKWKPISRVATAMQSSLTTSPSVLPRSLSHSSSVDPFSLSHSSFTSSLPPRLSSSFSSKLVFFYFNWTVSVCASV